MRLVTVLKIVAAAALVVVVALIAASKALDSARYQAFLADQVRGASGLELSFSGPTKIKLGLWPQVSFTGLTVATKPGGPALLYVDRIEARVALLPLVFRIIQVEKLALYRPMLRLTPMQRPSGTPDIGHGGDKIPPTTLAVSEVRIEDGVLVWRDAGSTSDSSLSIARAVIQPESLAGGPLTIQAEGRKQGTDFKLTGMVGAVSNLISGKPYPVQVKGEVSGALVVASGHVAEPLLGKGVDFDIKAQGDEFADLLRRSGIIAADKIPTVIGRYKISAKLSDAGVTDLDAVLGRRDGALVSLKGAIKTWATLSGVDLLLVAEADSLAGLSHLMGVDLPNGGPLKLSARLNDMEDGWRLTGIKSSLGKSDFTGELALGRGPRPRLFGRLAAAVFVPGDLSLPQTRNGESTRASPQRVAIPVDDGRILSLEAIPLDWLKGFDLAISLTASRLQLGGAILADAAAEIGLTNGRFVIEAIQARMGEGSISGEIRLDATGRNPSVAVKLAGSGVDLATMGGEGALVGGRGDFAIDVKALGASPRSLAGSLDGSFFAAFSDLSLSRADRELIGQLLGKLDDGGQGGRKIPCAALRLVAKGGKISVERGLTVETGRTTIAGSGSVDLRTESMDLAFAAKGGAGLRLRGMLGAPSFIEDGPPVRLSAEAASCRMAAKSRR
ncbi:AsmA family protein [Paramagnetospirillum kuznetsovii]|uniref:AsmA family protein n=1 Tax=Paramagnetospirillum kuznetsovii TaxID=2053833 RepID=A0A364NW28_9PROT|nr:AsmA family protein [Paramagnetospirillum kuznetsovii]RAU21262.1 AsmA family protein [Paramagnetospirillum kuznetsovii]